MKREIEVNMQPWDGELERLLHPQELPPAQEDQQSLEVLRRLRKIDHAILASTNMQAIEDRVLPLIAEMVPAEWIGITAADFARSEMHLAAQYSSGLDAGWSGRLEWNWNEACELPGPVHAVRDLSSVPQTSPFFEALQAAGIRSLLTVPLIMGGCIRGFLSFGRFEAYRWSLDDIHLARMIAAPLAIGIQRNAQQAQAETQVEKRQINAVIQAENLSVTGKLAVSLIHEINNPLQSAIGCLALTQEVIQEGGDISRYLRVANEELERAARIVSQLRDLNQQSAQENNRPVPVQDLLDHTLMLVSKKSKDQGVRITCHQQDQNGRLPDLPERIQQVFLNLALNAIEAMPNGGSLDVHLAQTGAPSGVSIAFIDSGTGIVEGAETRIFDPFFTRKSGGLGLGLYISKSIMHELGGRIEVTSAPGKGSTFAIWCPADGQADNSGTGEQEIAKN